MKKIILMIVMVVALAGIVSAFDCGDNILVNHIAGDVSPVTTIITYGTVMTDLTGENKCWITQNLGASQQASSSTDTAIASAGWYWQFNRKQGYNHDGTTLTPSWSSTAIDEVVDWTAINDPCAIELGTGWRLPTSTEWTNADSNGGWANYVDTFGSVLKLHAAGYLDDSDGALSIRGLRGYYWSSTRLDSTYGYRLYFGDSFSAIYHSSKRYGYSVRCINDGVTTPTFSTFTSTETTNFSEGDVTNITSLTLAIDNKGKIAFPLSHSINAEGEDYDTNVKIEDAMIYVNSADLDSSFNNSATLTFEGVNCNAPYVYYSDTATTRAAVLAEDNQCFPPRCTNIQCSAGTLTVDVTHFSGYAVNGTANLTIDADDPKYVGELVTFTAEYMNATGLIEGATCTISLPDGDHAMNELLSHIYNYSTIFSTAQTVEYNVTCSKAGENTVFANDTAIINAVDIPEFSTITLGLGLIAVLAGLVVVRKRY